MNRSIAHLSPEMPWFVSCCFEVFPNTASSMPRCTEEGAEGDPWRLKPARFSGAHGKKWQRVQGFQENPAKTATTGPSLNYINMEDGTWLWHQCPCFPMLSMMYQRPEVWELPGLIRVPAKAEVPVDCSRPGAGADEPGRHVWDIFSWANLGKVSMTWMAAMGKFI